MRLATALIATMSAVVLALLFASTRGSYEQTGAYVSRLTADVIELDQILKEYGPESMPVRQTLRDNIGPLVDSTWRENATDAGRVAPTSLAHRNAAMLYRIRELTPQQPRPERAAGARRCRSARTSRRPGWSCSPSLPIRSRGPS